jgi:hypothetical protein
MIVAIVQLVRGLRPGPITLALRALASRLIYADVRRCP